MGFDDALWSKLEAFDIDGASAAFGFADRLARENGWSRAFADRVIVEYKRFLYLAATGARLATPSEAVDQAWHLHLAYSRSYWERLCGETLGMTLHHEPTSGGDGAAGFYWDAYLDTLERYREAFGEPDREIWPSPKARFARRGGQRWVDLGTHWVLPRPTLAGVARAVVGGVALSAAGGAALAVVGYMGWVLTDAIWSWVAAEPVAQDGVRIAVPIGGLALIGLLGRRIIRRARLKPKNRGAGSGGPYGLCGGCGSGCGGGCGGCGG